VVAGDMPLPWTDAARTGNTLNLASSLGRPKRLRRAATASTELLILNLGDALAGFTWLGRLQNLSLEGCLNVGGSW
jgi:hypothetical protein